MTDTEYLPLATVADVAELQSKWGRGRALGRILALVLCGGCRRISVHRLQADSPCVIHREWQDEVQNYYQGVFGVSPREQLARLHFWGDPVSNRKDEAASDNYLGYCDLRPTRPATISGALIDLEVLSHDEKVYVTCMREYPVCIDGDTQKLVKAFPYVQQDGKCIVCAQAALASMSWHIAQEKNLTGPKFALLGEDIWPTGRTFPSQGMQREQIIHSIKKMGRAPVVHIWTSKEGRRRGVVDLPAAIYRYVESGVPVLVGIKTAESAHALVIIGHTFRPNRWLAETFASYYGTDEAYRSNLDWIDGFVVQDDNCGPYVIMPSGLFGTALCEFIVVPAYEGTFLEGHEAELFVGYDILYGALKERLLELQEEGRRREQPIDISTETWFEEFMHQYWAKSLVLRTYLCRSTEWKDRARGYPVSSGDTGVRSILEQVSLPDHVWVVEISWAQIFSHDRQCCGEFLIDPTDKPDLARHALKQMWLWLHIPGLVMIRDPVTEAITERTWPDNDVPYGHHLTGL